MRLHRLEIAAFGPFAARVTVDFDELSAAGLFLLHGPTGAGKTSVLDAVCYALYGSVPGARQGGQSLRSDHADPSTPTEVVLDFTVGGRRLRITRRPEQPRPKKKGSGYTRDKAQTWLSEYVCGPAAAAGTGGSVSASGGAGPGSGGAAVSASGSGGSAVAGGSGGSGGEASAGTGTGTGAWKSLSRSHKETADEIDRLLGMSKEQFCQVVLLPQGDFARFLRADAEARGKLLGRLFDTRRFAAVEDRLNDLRRTAEKRVAAGDDRLLALAHRMAQAAGDSADLRHRPLPEHTPGEPGLAAAVLEWAAVARAGARERLDIAAVAVRAAEEAHRAAQRHADAVRERARLQQRHAEARRRAAVLEERRPALDELRARLDRGRAADAVAPALDLRDAAEREHHAAVAARRRAAERLPADLADAGAEALAALERAARQELGGLAAAERAERRAAAIAAECDRLDREAVADDDVLAETGRWLAEWEDARADHQRRVEAAQEAAARAEHLAGRVEPAERRLAAARRRDRLGAEAEAAQERLLRAREDAAAAHELWLDLKERRLRGIAAELAARLTAGEPCAVCGATEHPAPAHPGAGHVDRAAEEGALADHQDAERARQEAERRLGAVREALAAAAAEAGEATTAELALITEALRREHAEARAAAGDLHAAREALAHAEREHERRRAGQLAAERRAAARASHREALLRERSALEKDVAAARGDAATVAERAARLEHRVAVLAEAAEASRTAEESAQRLKEADARLADAAYRAGFTTPREAADAVLPETERRAAQREIDAWQAESAAVAAVLADERALAAAALEPADPVRAQERVEAATRGLREASAAEAAARTRCADLARLSAQATADAVGLAPLRREYERVARLAALAAGTSAENEHRMRLESYVLAARLEQVAAAASARLHRMSSGRYTLVHSDARGGGRGRFGLGLHVVDAWTGAERDTASLSGGETFFASLALALGLADVVTDEAGGVRLDTLFIDEGFGSLDEQALDEVLDVLDSLRERDRTVGIVSHVADLRQRVPVRLEIVKDRAGSTVRHHRHGGLL
ncbi:AAA family ATPase [Streptomyces sp. URMC 123]|uniref:AAA family ATPase n=2 Tax=unclassified Streptomyces TaxID=2593676 RepID=UPI003F19E5FC